MSVNQLRQTIRQRRRRLGVGAQLRAAKRLVDAISTMAVYQSSRRVALYLATDGELNCRQLIKALWRQRKQCLLPVLVDDKSGELGMAFGIYLPGGVLQKNRFGIREPSRQVLMAPASLDLVLLPLVAFDASCNRVGMGGGFYDRAFAFRALKPGKPRLIGVGHRLQQVSRLIPAAWDVPLDGVVAC